MNQDLCFFKRGMFYILCFSVLSGAFFSGCELPRDQSVNDAEVLHENLQTLNRVMVYDVFSPPVCSRIYGYTALASYEAMRYADPKCNSLIKQLKGFAAAPEPIKHKTYNFTLAATKAFFTVAHHMIFSGDSLIKYEQVVYTRFKGQLDDSTYNRSVILGEQIAKVIIKRADFDNYPQTRGKPKYLGNNGHAEWRPTPPDYFDGLEYCWGTMEPFAITSSKQFPLPHPALYSEDKNSVYFKQEMEVYELSKHETQEQKNIAKFWDDNPFNVMHDGHMTYAVKKISPGGHWMNITMIACKKTKANAVKTAQAYAMTAIGLFDAFICSWEAKYEYSFIRPISVINEVIDPNWTSLLQTPPFPEYPAGHADISAASAVMLTHEFGNLAFQDTTEMKYIGQQRNFKSFSQAAEETAYSRFYGQIHTLKGSLIGGEQGKEVSEFILSKLKLYR